MGLTRMSGPLEGSCSEEACSEEAARWRARFTRERWCFSLGCRHGIRCQLSSHDAVTGSLVPALRSCTPSRQACNPTNVCLESMASSEPAEAVTVLITASCDR